MAGRGRLATHLGGPEAGCLLTGDLHLGLCPEPTLTWRTGCAPVTICRPSLTPASLLLLPPIIIIGGGSVLTQQPPVTMATDQDTTITQSQNQQQQPHTVQQPYYQPLQPVAPSEDDSQLAGLLRLLVLSAERCLSRVPLAELAYPLDHCLSVQPQRVLKKDSCIQTSAMFELDTTIPHIDSDEEHETNHKCEYHFSLLFIIFVTTHVSSAIFILKLLFQKPS